MEKYYLLTISFHFQNESGISDIGFVADEQHPLRKSILKEIVCNSLKLKDNRVTLENLTIFVTNVHQFENEQEYKDFWQ